MKLLIIPLTVLLLGCEAETFLSKNSPADFIIPLKKYHYNWTPTPHFEKTVVGPPSVYYEGRANAE